MIKQFSLPREIADSERKPLTGAARTETLLALSEFRLAPNEPGDDVIIIEMHNPAAKIDVYLHQLTMDDFEWLGDEPNSSDAIAIRLGKATFFNAQFERTMVYANTCFLCSPEAVLDTVRFLPELTQQQRLQIIRLVDASPVPPKYLKGGESDLDPVLLVEVD